jgi:hypothetical protein
MRRLIREISLANQLWDAPRIYGITNIAGHSIQQGHH